MDKRDKIASLTRCALFSGIPPAAIDEIGEIAEEKVFSADTVIYKNGESHEKCYIIVTGAVELFRKSSQATEYSLTRLGPCDSFGELSLLTDNPMSGSAKTIENTTLIVIHRHLFEPILMKYPDVLHAVGKKISAWAQSVGSVIDTEADLRSRGQRMTFFDFLLILCLSFFIALIYNAANPKSIPLFSQETIDAAISIVTPLTAFEKHKSGTTLFVDAMPSSFYDTEHIQGAINLPLAIFDFMYDMTLAQDDKEKEVVVYGRTISKHYDVEVANKLVIRGHKNVMILEGGLDTWKRIGFPLEP